MIELLGGPGCGKSTLAAGVFVELKRKGVPAEMIPEHVKYWAWDGHPVGPFDQIYLFGRQARYESRLYGKVDFIVSDSPVIMYPVYEEVYQHHSIIRESVLAFLKYTAESGINRKTFYLPRVVGYEEQGRFETSEMLTTIDTHLKQFYDEQGYPYTVLGSDSSRWVDEILGAIQ